MRPVLFRDERYWYRTERVPKGWLDHDTRITVFVKRTSPLRLFRPYRLLGSTVVRPSESNVKALTRLLKELHSRRSGEPPLLIECSPEIESLYRDTADL